MECSSGKQGAIETVRDSIPEDTKGTTINVFRAIGKFIKKGLYLDWST
jgi:hypothetical protein